MSLTNIFLALGAVVLIFMFVFGIVVPSSQVASINQTTNLNAQVVYVKSWVVSGGLFYGQQDHQNVQIKVSDGTILNKTYSCNFYQLRMNLTVSKTVQESPNYPSWLPKLSGPYNITELNYTSTQTLTTITANLNFTETALVLSDYTVSYSVLNVPEGCA